MTTRLSRTERSARFQQKKSTDEMLKVAEQSAQEVPKPVKAPSEPDTSYRQRRDKPVVPEQKPLTWTDALDKWNPLPRK